MPKTQEQNDELKEQRKQNIVLAALIVFCEKGYDGTTVDDITKKAKCSHGLFYHYFDSKKAVFDAVIENAENESDQKIDKILKENISYVDKLKKILIHLFENLKEDELKAYYFFFFFSRHFIDVLNGRVPQKPPREKKPLFILIEELFEKGIENGEFSNEYSAREYGKLLHSIIQGVTMMYSVMPNEIKKTFNPPDVDLIVNIFKK